MVILPESLSCSGMVRSIISLKEKKVLFCFNPRFRPEFYINKRTHISTYHPKMDLNVKSVKFWLNTSLSNRLAKCLDFFTTGLKNLVALYKQKRKVKL